MTLVCRVVPQRSFRFIPGSGRSSQTPRSDGSSPTTLMLLLAGTLSCGTAETSFPLERRTRTGPSVPYSVLACWRVASHSYACRQGPSCPREVTHDRHVRLLHVTTGGVGALPAPVSAYAVPITCESAIVTVESHLRHRIARWQVHGAAPHHAYAEVRPVSASIALIRSYGLSCVPFARWSR